MVLYFTGTGNSRYLARRIAEGLEMPLYDLNACIKAGDTAPVSYTHLDVYKRQLLRRGKTEKDLCSN